MDLRRKSICIPRLIHYDGAVKVTSDSTKLTKKTRSSRHIKRSQCPCCQPEQKKRTRSAMLLSCHECSTMHPGKAALSNHVRQKHGVMKLNNPSAGPPSLERASALIETSTEEVMEEEQVETVDEVDGPQGVSMEDESDEQLEDLENSEDGEDDHTKLDGEQMICKLCGDERFEYRTKGQRKTFWIHMDIHYGRRPFICPFPSCQASFISDIRLLTHSSLHTGEKNFECVFCLEKFKTKTFLNAHNKKCKGEQ